jgi:hypothetical protein
MQRRTTKVKANFCCAKALVLIGALCSTKAGAAQFSFQCQHVRDLSGIREFLTFDDEQMRVIAYGIGIENKVVNAIFKGTIHSVSPDEVQFDLVVALDEIKVGNFILNRKEGWMSAVDSEGHYEMKDTCRDTAIRSPLDLWRLYEVDR